MQRTHLYGWANGLLYNFLNITQIGLGVNFSSPGGGSSTFTFDQTTFYGVVQMGEYSVSDPKLAYYFGSGYGRTSATRGEAEIAVKGQITVLENAINDINAYLGR